MTKKSLIYKQLSELLPYVSNSRTHSEAQVTQIADSITEFGFTNPILIDESNGVIAGHGRILAAKKLNITEVPTICLDNLTDVQKKAYIIADNKLALNAGWDDEMLRLEIEELKDLDFDIDLLGFDDDELELLIPIEDVEGLTDEDAVPEPPETPVSVLGDVWLLGNHRLMCGDSTSIDAVEKLMDGQKADMVFTDPPYGMSYGGGRSAGSSKKGALVKAHGMIIGDDLQGDELLQMVSGSIGNATALGKEGAAAYVCFTWRTYTEFHAALSVIDLVPKACIVWDKKSVGLGNSNYRPQHEFIFYCKGEWHGDKSQADVWYMSRGATGAYVHPTQKPVELIEKAINNSSKSGDIIHDCFGGSGSTLIACEKTNRNSRLMELDEKYIDVIINRWQNFTGKQATHAVSGKTYLELANG
jgi:DNA modification methylase|tara:strand:- start:4816 stop:6063 length:1248 start_codon:yes stop_codon:yes gene_type:complete